MASRGDNSGMDTNQNKVIETLREVHLLAFNEFERLNLRIAELESTGLAAVLPHPPLASGHPLRDTG
jgi:hypothetical protein